MKQQALALALAAAAAATCAPLVAHASASAAAAADTDDVAVDAGGNWFESFAPASRAHWVASQEPRYAGSAWNWTGDAARVSAVPKFYGLSRVLDAPVSPSAEDGFVVQYEVTLAGGVTCSGAYLKLLAHDEGFDPAALAEQTPYSIMFGPDNCGSTHKVHVILRQRNPVTGAWEEKHMAQSVSPPTDREPHLYTLELRPDSSFSVKIDGEEKATGSLATDADFLPPFAAPREIDDPADSKPADWVDEPKMPDADAVKPDDWDEDAPKTIFDPEAVKPAGWLDDEPSEVPDPAVAQPEDWSEEDDGVWEAPLVSNPQCAAAPGCGVWAPPVIANPAYKGKWTRPLIDNPAYKGVWKPRRIPNPGFFEEPHPVRSLAPVGAVAIEILANDRDIAFDSVMLGGDLPAARAFAAGPFLARQQRARQAGKSAAAAGAREERLRAYEQGGFQGMALYAAGEAQERAQELWAHAPVLLVSIAVGAVAAAYLLLARCCCGNGSGVEAAALGREARHKKDDDAEEDDGEDGEVDVDKSGLDPSAKVPGEEADDAESEDDDDDEDDDEDDGEAAAAAGTRRRVARAT